MTLLESAARFLGAEYEAQYGKYVAQVEIDDGGDMYNALSPGDLLNALLLRAAELGHEPYLSFELEWTAILYVITENPTNRSYWDRAQFVADGPTPLNAVMKAVAAMEAK